MNRNDTKKLLRQERLAPSKKLGQNFLVHQQTADKIVQLADINEKDTVVEVGVGLGALTIPLAQKARQVIGIETDSGIIRLHEEKKTFPPNVTLLHQDILKADFGSLAGKCGGKLKIIANLPYSISNPFLFKLFENSHLMGYGVIMLQKEVAQRLSAPPGCKAYGVPTVLLASCAETRTLMELKPEEFHPKPKIDSRLIKLTFSPRPERVKKIGEIDYKWLRRVVNAAFGQRRKTLLNTLVSGRFGLDKKEMEKIIRSCNISPDCRGEKLTVEEFVLIGNKIREKCNSKEAQ